MVFCDNSSNGLRQSSLKFIGAHWGPGPILHLVHRVTSLALWHDSWVLAPGLWQFCQSFSLDLQLPEGPEDSPFTSALSVHGRRNYLSEELVGGYAPAWKGCQERRDWKCVSSAGCLAGWSQPYLFISRDFWKRQQALVWVVVTYSWTYQEQKWWVALRGIPDLAGNAPGLVHGAWPVSAEWTWKALSSFQGLGLLPGSGLYTIRVGLSPPGRLLPRALGNPCTGEGGVPAPFSVN